MKTTIFINGCLGFQETMNFFHTPASYAPSCLPQSGFDAGNRRWAAGAEPLQEQLETAEDASKRDLH